MALMKKLLPIGLSDFKELIDDQYYYVDKTLLIDELKRTAGKVILIPRPRRFGKTLNLSMLRYFYEKAETSNRYLFEQTEIWKLKHYHSVQGTFPVIYLSFKDCKMTSWEQAYEKLKKIIAEEFRRHADFLLPLLSPYDKKDYCAIMDQTGSPVAFGDSLYLLAKVLKHCYKKRVILLIDEYDTPMQSGYSNGYYSQVVDFVRTLLTAVLKDNPSLQRGILTGVLRAAKEGIFSGLNNLRVCSLLDKKYADKFGFTEQEVDELLRAYSIQTKSESIKQWYNGYRCGSILLFNPWSLLECIDHEGELRTYWGNTSDNALIKKILPLAQDETKYDLEELMRGGTVIHEINEGLVFPGIEQEPEAVWNLLFYAGYLTYRKRIIKEGSAFCVLAIPNQEVQAIYYKMISGLLEESLDTRKLTMLIHALEQGDSETLTQILDDYICSSFSSFDVPESEPEKSYHLFMLGLLVVLHGRYEVRSNRESGYGRYDIMLIPVDRTKPGIILEFKKVSKVLKETLETAAEKALSQIREKRYEQELRDLKVPSVIAFGIAFDGKRILVLKQKS
jgi:hypothetical protein